MSGPRIAWPSGKAFAFTVFDDTDSQTLARGRPVYSLLADLGFRTTKSVWMLNPSEPSTDIGPSCEDSAYLQWVQELQRLGFEIGYHTASARTSRREATIRALDRFRDEFGHYPRAMANHYASREGMYFGDARLGGSRRLAYNLITGFRNHKSARGHVPGDPLFWGDLCQQRIDYVRSFTFQEINTLKACPWMPYHDPERPYVARWFASSEGAQAPSFLERIAEANQDQLEAEGGACIMYTHFGLRFLDERGQLRPRFRALMERLGSKNGWFVPVSTLLDYLRQANGSHVLTDRQRTALEWKWLLQKIRYGSA